MINKNLRFSEDCSIIQRNDYKVMSIIQIFIVRMKVFNLTALLQIFYELIFLSSFSKTKHALTS